MSIGQEWVMAHAAGVQGDGPETVAVARLKGLLSKWASVFAGRRPDVESAVVTWPRRGLVRDEVGSFLHAVDAGLVTVDDAGYVTLPTPPRGSARAVLPAREEWLWRLASEMTARTRDRGSPQPRTLAQHNQKAAREAILMNLQNATGKGLRAHAAAPLLSSAGDDVALDILG